MFGQGDSLWTPPVAGALREQPKGQDPPRKAGTGAYAVIRHRLFGAIPLHYGSVTVRYEAITDPLQIPYSFITARYALLRPGYGSVPTPTKIRLISVTDNHRGAATATPGACGAQAGESPTEAGTRRRHDYRLDYGKGDSAVMTDLIPETPIPRVRRAAEAAARGWGGGGCRRRSAERTRWLPARRA